MHSQIALTSKHAVGLAEFRSVSSEGSWRKNRYSWGETVARRNMTENKISENKQTDITDKRLNLYMHVQNLGYHVSRRVDW